MTGTRVLVIAALAAFLALIVASAWVCDDAYITFRTVDNFLHGYGLRWNVAERVQVFTHPLWMGTLVVLGAFTDSLYACAIAASLACSMAAVALLAFGIARTPGSALLGLAPLLFSSAFVDYSTSGLENPLSHLLLAVFLWLWLVRKSDLRSLTALSACAALLALNRIDLLVLVGPALLQAFLRQPSRRAAGSIFLGMAPLLAWEVFSVIYYGFPLPNTAYAKLGTGIESALLWSQGGLYLLDSLRNDPLTLVATGIAIGGGLTRGDRREQALAGGALLYLLYVVSIGGDFMSGRFLAAPLFVGCGLLSRWEAPGRSLLAGAWTAAVGLAALGSAPPWSRGPDFGVDGLLARPIHGIVNERAFYYPHTGLVRTWLGRGRPENHPFAVQGREAQETGTGGAAGQALGLHGYHAGPGVHILDVVALTDPLLARLPARKGSWRIGHFERAIPPGYARTLQEAENHVQDPDLADYTDAIRNVTRGPLFTRDRWRDIVRLNLEAAPASR